MADTSHRDKAILNRRVDVLAAVCALMAIALGAVRIYHTISISEPLQLMTSGDEVASIFAIWKALNGLDIYTDRFQPPYALAAYNWLFYSSSALWSGIWMKALGLGDAWIPTLARSWTLAGAAIGGGIAYLFLHNVLRRGGMPRKILPMCLATLLVFGPLYGFWATTARPDVWSISLEIIAVIAFLSLYRKNRVAAVIVMAAIAYLAWSFKHTTIFGIGGVALFLLLRRDFGAFVLLSAISLVLWAIPLLTLGDLYVETLFAIGHPLEYGVRRLPTNLMNFAVKTPYLWLPLIWIVASLVYRKKFWAFLTDDTRALSVCALTVALPMSCLMMLQSGSAENYLFSVSFFATVLLVSLLPLAQELSDGVMRHTRNMMKLGFLLTSLAIGAVFTGYAGLLGPRGDQAQYNQQKACLDQLPRPLYVASRRLSLPWNTPGNVPYVLSFYYERERRLERTFANGGVGGMIDAGAFEAVIYPAIKVPDTIDGSDLLLYQPLPEPCANMTIFLRTTRIDIDDIRRALKNLP